MKRRLFAPHAWKLLPLAAFALTAGSCSSDLPPVTRMKLSQTIEGRAITVLREGLRLTGEENFWVSMHAAEGLTLGGLGGEVIEFVEPRLATETDTQRLCGLARELVRAGKREHVAVLAEVLARPDSHGHTHAAESLYKVHEVGDEAIMRERFEKGGDIKLRLMAAAALARQGDAGAFAFIRETLRGTDPDGIQIAAWILGIIGGSEDIEPIRSRLADAPTPIIRAYLEHSLAALGDEEGLRLLSRNLEDPDPVIRTYAATFAGDAKAYSTQPQLEAMLDDSFQDARVRAAQTLLQLSQ
jgi:sialidase-1